MADVQTGRRRARRMAAAAIAGIIEDMSRIRLVRQRRFNGYAATAGQR
jgi:hypothetical protein